MLIFNNFIDIFITFLKIILFIIKFLGGDTG